MRIGIFDPYMDDLGGGEKYMLSIAECLSKNHNVDIFWDNKEDISQALKRFTLDLSKVKIKNNMFASNVPFLRRVLASRFYDIIIVLSDGSIPFLLAKNLFIHIQRPFNDLEISLKTRIKLLKVKKIFCNSYFTKSYVDRAYGVNSEILYPPISLQNKRGEKENIILHVGRFRVKSVKIGDYKKQSVMVNAFKRMIKNDISDWKLIIAVGVKDKDKEELEKMIKSAKGFPIEFVVNKNNDELLELYSKAKIYWHATGFGEDLNRHPDYAEHFGISTVEAMGAGAVPVVINAGGQKEIVEHAKNGFLWNTIDELVSYTSKLISDRQLLRRMSEEAVLKSRIFSGHRFCKELEEIVFK